MLDGLATAGEFAARLAGLPEENRSVDQLKCFIVIFPTDTRSGMSVRLRNLGATILNIRDGSQTWGELSADC